MSPDSLRRELTEPGSGFKLAIVIPALNEAENVGAVRTETTMSLSSRDWKTISPPSRVKRGRVPPSVEICHFPPSPSRR